MRRSYCAILSVLVVVFWPFATAAAASGSIGTRSISILIVTPPDDGAKKGVTAWLQAFKNNIRYLTDFPGVWRGNAGLKVEVTTREITDYNSDMLESCFDPKASLQTLSTVARNEGASTFVDNDIYLGELHGSLPTLFVYISREIKPSEYGPTREALSVVTLYAYAMAIAQTESIAGDRYAICSVLDRANMYKDRNLGAKVQDYLKGVFEAISTELEARSCGGKK